MVGINTNRTDTSYVQAQSNTGLKNLILGLKTGGPESTKAQICNIARVIFQKISDIVLYGITYASTKIENLFKKNDPDPIPVKVKIEPDKPLQISINKKIPPENKSNFKFEIQNSCDPTGYFEHCLISLANANAESIDHLSTIGKEVCFRYNGEISTQDPIFKININGEGKFYIFIPSENRLDSKVTDISVNGDKMSPRGLNQVVLEPNVPHTLKIGEKTYQFKIQENKQEETMHANDEFSDDKSGSDI